jgi:hypothetical protein
MLAAALSAPPARLVPVHAANAPGDSLSACDGRVIAYSARDQIKDGTFLLERSTRAGGALLYYGAAHSRDPQHPQFAEIEARWKGFKPTVAFYEGPSRPIADSATDTIMRFGESGYVRWLARRDGARVERLEPEVQSESRIFWRTSRPSRSSSSSFSAKRPDYVKWSHVPMQRPALECALADDSSREESNE